MLPFYYRDMHIPANFSLIVSARMVLLLSTLLVRKTE